MTHVAIVGGTIVTMDEERRIIDGGTVLIEDDEISAVGHRNSIEIPDSAEILNAEDTAVLPGLINAHTHVPQILLRGGGSHDRDLLDWLFNVLYPGLAVYKREDIRVGTLLYCVEALRGGITTIVANEDVSPQDFDRAAAPAIDAYEQAGIRTIYARMYFDVAREELAGLVGSIMSKEPDVQHVNVIADTDQILDQLDALVRKYHGRANGKIQVWPAPAIPFLVTEKGIRAGSEIARRNRTMWTMHLAESAIEARVHGMSATEYCRNLGVLEPELLVAHCVHADSRDVRLLRAFDVKVSTQPGSNSYLACGVAPVPSMLAHGVTVGIGTDDANCNDSVNLIGDLKTLSLVHRAVHQDASIITPEKALEMATIDGAHAVGLSTKIGSIEVGKQADVFTLDLIHPQMTPHNDIAATVVFQANGSEVRDVMVAGEWRILDGQPTFLDADQYKSLLANAQARANGIFDRSGIAARRQWTTRGA